MSSPRRFCEFAVRARNDFAEILLQSLLEWGENQADRFEREIDWGTGGR